MKMFGVHIIAFFATIALVAPVVQATKIVSTNFYGTLGFIISEQEKIQEEVKKNNLALASEIARLGTRPTKRLNWEARNWLRKNVKKDLETKYPILFVTLKSFLNVIDETYKQEADALKIPEFQLSSKSLEGLKDLKERLKKAKKVYPKLVDNAVIAENAAGVVNKDFTKRMIKAIRTMRKTVKLIYKTLDEKLEE